MLEYVDIKHTLKENPWYNIYIYIWLRILWILMVIYCPCIHILRLISSYFIPFQTYSIIIAIHCKGNIGDRMSQWYLLTLLHCRFELPGRISKGCISIKSGDATELVISLWILPQKPTPSRSPKSCILWSCNWLGTLEHEMAWEEGALWTEL